MNSSSETTSSGTHANKTGNRLEKFVRQALIDYGYKEFWNYKEQVFANRKTVGGKQFSCHVAVGKTIYETKRIVDFLVINHDLFPEGLIIECKWQQSGGSVDEKYPFLLYNIMRTGVPTILLLDGGGYKKEAEKWIREQANPARALMHVWNMSEFQKAVNNGLFGLG